MRRILIIFVSLALIGLSVYFGLKFYGATHANEDTFVSRLATKLFDYNSVEVHPGEGVEVDKIKIVHRESGKTVFKNGENYKGELNVYGMISFEFYYADTLISEIAHWRKNNWHVNTYHFDVYKTGSGVDAILEIQGIDSANVIYYVNERPD